MELIQVGEKTYYIKNPTNIGIYKVDDKNVYLIDSGNDKDAGKKILNLVESQGWNIIGIINTHSNADHIGGNKVIQDRTNAKVLAYGIEKAFTEYPLLEPSFLYGGYPFKEIRNKFLLAKDSDVVLLKNNLPEGLEYFELKGHFFDMIGIKTSDDVYFLADSLFSEETILKYHLFFIYDVKEFLNTLDYIKELKGNLFIASHVSATSNVQKLVDINKAKVMEIIDNIYKFLKEPATFESILKNIFDEYELEMNPNQYVLVGSTLKSYLAYLSDEGKITFEFIDNRMLWMQKD